MITTVLLETSFYLLHNGYAVNKGLLCRAEAGLIT